MKKLLIIVFMLACCLPIHAEAIKDLAGAGSGGGGGDMVSADFRYSAGATSSLTHSNISALEFQVDAFTCNIFDNTGFTGQPKEYNLIQTTVTLTDNMTNYIVADYNSGSPIVDVETNPDNFNGSRVPVMKVYAGGGVTHEMHMDGFGLGLSNKLNRRFISTQAYARESGLAISMQSAANTNFDVSAGKVWFGAQRLSLGAVDSTTDDIHLVSPAGVVTSITAFDNNNYFNGETLTVVSNNQYAVNWVYRGVEVDEEVYIMLGDDSYTLNEAETAVAPSAPAVINSHAMLIGKVVFAKANPVPTSIQSAFDVVFANAVATVHNDLAGLNAGDFQHLTAAEKIIAIAYDSVLFNTFVGGGALESATTGTYNVAIGDTALDNLTTGIGNVAIGRLAGNGGLIGWTDSVTDTYMTFVGINTSRDNNTANSTAFTYSTALGAGAKVSKSNQMVFGTSANTENKFYGDILVDDAVIATFTAGEKLIALYGSLIRDFEAKHIDAESATFTAGIEVNNATFTGDVSFDGATVTGLPTADPLYDALDNTFVGETGIPAVTTGYDNTLMGKDALKDLTTGYHNVAVGAGSLVGNTTGYDNVAMGFEALGYSVTSNWGNVAVGKYSMKNNRGGDGNVAIGYQSIYYNPTTYFTGNDNVAIGNRAGGQMTSGSSNVALGKSSMYSNNTGSKNVAIGQEALNTGVGGENNIGIGFGSGRNDGTYNISLGSYNLTSGHTAADHNIAMGQYSLKRLTAGDDNVAIGQEALENLTTTSNNTAIGKAAGYGDTVGYSDSVTDANCTFLGALASRDSTIANTTAFTNSTALGYNAKVSKSNQMVFGTSANTENLFYGAIYKDGVELVPGVPTYDTASNTFVGEDALTSIGTGYGNTGFGFNALTSNTEGTLNTAIGARALEDNTTGNWNTALGQNALASNTTGVANTALGYRALESNTTNDSCIAIGHKAMYQADNVAHNGGNIAIGSLAQSDSEGYDNISIGALTLANCEPQGFQNIAIGHNAMMDNTAGTQNVAVGHFSLDNNTTGNEHTAIGQHALGYNTTGGQNTAVGNYSLGDNVTGDHCTALGYYALAGNLTDKNTAVGSLAGTGSTMGYSNSKNDTKMTFIGKDACRDATIANTTVFTNSTALGYNARVSKSNQMVFGTSANTENLFYGAIYKDGVELVAGVPTYDTNDNTFVGEDALTGIATGTGTTSNTAMGYKALTTNETGNFNVGIGAYAITANVDGNYNTAMGYGAMATGSGGTYNVGVGTQAGNASGSCNVALGYQTLKNCTNSWNVGVGYNVMTSNTGSGNVGIGRYALLDSLYAINNVGVGRDALKSITTGAANTAVGSSAGYGTAVGYSDSKTDTGMTFVGADASRDSTIANSTVFTNSTAIGYSARVNKSNQVVLGNSSVAETVLRGDLVLDNATIDGDRTIYKNTSGLVTYYDVALGGPDLVMPASVNGTTVTSVVPELFVGARLFSLDMSAATSLTSTSVSMCQDNSLLTTAILPEGMTTIAASTFFGCSRMTSVTIPSSVTMISINSFRDCDDLTSVTFPSGLTTLGTTAFQECNALTSVTIPSSVTTFGTSIFEECSAITTITVDDTITSDMFYGCPITSITIGAGATIASDFSCGSNGTGFTAAYGSGGAGTYLFTTVWTKQ